MNKKQKKKQNHESSKKDDHIHIKEPGTYPLNTFEVFNKIVEIMKNRGCQDQTNKILNPFYGVYVD